MNTEISAEQIKIVDKIEITTLSDIIKNEEIILEIINSIKNCLDKRLGCLTNTDIRKDILKDIDIGHLIQCTGGNENPAFCRIINMYNNDYIAEIVISWQSNILKPKKRFLSRWFNWF